MGSQSDFDKKKIHGGPLEILLDFKGMSMGFPLDSYEILNGILYDSSKGFLWDWYEI